MSESLSPSELACLGLLRALADSPGANETVRIRQLMTRLRQIFPDTGHQVLIDALAAGAEAALDTAPTAESGSRKGFADTLQGNLLLEFKRDLGDLAAVRTAHLELRRYTAACWRQDGPAGVARAVMTDVAQWVVFRPEPTVSIVPEDGWTSEHVSLVEIERFDGRVIDAARAVDLRRLLQRTLIDRVRLPLTAGNVRRAFGRRSQLFDRAVGKALSGALARASEAPDVRLALRLWNERVRYGAGEPADALGLYAEHVYLILLSRVLVAAVLAAPTGGLVAADLPGLLDGGWFRARLPVDGLAEHDFFGWLGAPCHRAALLPVMSELLDGLRAFHLDPRAGENVLQHIYDEMLPADGRAMLGQASTPAPMARRVVDAVVGGVTDRVLDPACGCGTFLVSVLGRARAQLAGSGVPRDEWLPVLAAHATGIDVDPVAVALAKAAWVLALHDLLGPGVATVRVPVFHADALFLAGHQDDPPDAPTIRFDGDRHQIPVPPALLAHPAAFDRFVNWCRDRAARLATRAPPGALQVAPEVLAAVQPDMRAVLADAWSDALGAGAMGVAARALVGALAASMLQERDGVWAFFLRNRYGPTLLGARFDAIVGNPPWLTISHLPDGAPFRDALLRILDDQKIRPRGASAHHLELATPFLLHAVGHYLRPGGRFGVLMPRSLFDADHHHPFRLAQWSAPVSVDSVWDLAAVDDLFRVPACALLGRRAAASGGPAAIQIASGDGVMGDSAPLRLAHFGAKSAWVSGPGQALPSSAHYPGLFRQGADLMPRTAVFVDASGPVRGDGAVGVVTAAAELANRNNKVLKGVRFDGRVSRQHLFRTVTSTVLLPFLVQLDRLPLVALPLGAPVDDVRSLLSEDTLFDSGHSDSARWFGAIDDALAGSNDIRRRLDTRNKLTNQRYDGAPYLVHIGMGGAVPCAGWHPGPAGWDRPFVADQTTYVMAVSDPVEAAYVVGVVNSSALSSRIRAFQSKGLLGARHVHKLAQQAVPPFDPTDPLHLRISRASDACAAAAAVAVTPSMADTTRALAPRRLAMRKALAAPLASLDAAVGAMFDR